MQALTARAAPCSAAAPAHQRQRQQRRGGSLLARADVGFCRDKVSERTDKMDEIEGTATIVFLGENGLEVEVECPKGGYILDAGLEAGLELPFTCKGGICGCCVGRVAEGSIDQSDIADISFVLTEEEVASGLSLMCMSRPVSDVVRIETQSDWGYSLGSNDWKGPSGHILGKSIDPLMGTRWGSNKAGQAAEAGDAQQE